MNFKVIKTDLDGFILEDLGTMSDTELQNFAMSFIPEIFVSESEVREIMNIIMAEGADDWFISGPAVINIRRVEE